MILNGLNLSRFVNVIPSAEYLWNREIEAVMKSDRCGWKVAERILKQRLRFARIRQMKRENPREAAPRRRTAAR